MNKHNFLAKSFLNFLLLILYRYTSSRTAAVESIEKTLGELQGIFSDLIALVAEQGDAIQRYAFSNPLY